MPKKQGPNFEDHTRAKIAMHLPGAIDCAVQSYRRFANQLPPEDAKEFAAHHAACKTAIAHIELLLKLATWARLPSDSGDDGNLAGLMADAQAELTRLQEDDDACNND